MINKIFITTKFLNEIYWNINVFQNIPIEAHIIPLIAFFKFDSSLTIRTLISTSHYAHILSKHSPTF